MFWTDWVSSTPQNGKIEQAWMDGTNQKSLIESQLHWPNGLSIDYVDRKLYWCDAFLHKIERADLDGNNREVCIPRVCKCCKLLGWPFFQYLGCHLPGMEKIIVHGLFFSLASVLYFAFVPT